MPRSIPKRTMVDKWKAEKEVTEVTGLVIGLGNILKGTKAEKPGMRKYVPKEASYEPRVYKKPREWRYVTKPFFRKIKEPLFDVFKEADEVNIIIDLGSFDRTEVFFGIKGNTYVITGKHEDSEFKEEIPLPMKVDINKMEEHYKNDILELILPRKREKNATKKRKQKLGS